MTTLKNRWPKVFALVLTVALTQVYVQADLLRAASARLAGSPAAQAQGRLTTRNDAPITAGGNQVKTGDTIFSGQAIQTPAGTGATVDLGPLGRVDIAPNADVVITFEGNRIHVKVNRGCVIVYPSKGTPVVVEASGAVISDPNGGGPVDVCASDSGGAPIIGKGAAAAAGAGAIAAPVVIAGTAAGISTGAVVGGLLGAGGLITAAIVVPCRRGANPSPGTPRGRNDECRD
ncbi:MAG TPA: hypothetical protein VD968_01000 [Pyrinomonadaceae bacterium]|nr:hypothetical protein [Pyrinomonadaceae bacterium]